MVARIGSSLFLLFSSLFPLRADTASFFGLLAFFFQDFCPVRFRKQFVFPFFKLGGLGVSQCNILLWAAGSLFALRKKKACPFSYYGEGSPLARQCCATFISERVEVDHGTKPKGGRPWGLFDKDAFVGFIRR